MDCITCVLAQHVPRARENELLLSLLRMPLIATFGLGSCRYMNVKERATRSIERPCEACLTEMYSTHWYSMSARGH